MLRFIASLLAAAAVMAVAVPAHASAPGVLLLRQSLSRMHVGVHSLHFQFSDLGTFDGQQTVTTGGGDCVMRGNAIRVRATVVSPIYESSSDSSGATQTAGWEATQVVLLWVVGERPVAWSRGQGMESRPHWQRSHPTGMWPYVAEVCIGSPFFLATCANALCTQVTRHVPADVAVRSTEPLGSHRVWDLQSSQAVRGGTQQSPSMFTQDTDFYVDTHSGFLRRIVQTIHFTLTDSSHAGNDTAVYDFSHFNERVTVSPPKST
jgi:hypothetical protein